MKIENTTPFRGIILLGLGPGDPGQVTRQAWDILMQAEKVYLRTKNHPVVGSLPGRLKTASFDSVYDAEQSFERVYERIVAEILSHAEQGEPVIYAVPGHPMVAEATCPGIIQRAGEREIPVQIVAGMSFLEPVFAALGVDPFPQTSLVDAFELAGLHVPAFPVDRPALVAQVHSRRMASEVKLTLMSLYPDEHPVTLVHAAGTEMELVERLPLHEIDRSDSTGLLTCLYLAPLAPQSSLESLHEVITHLRAPDGCPWDREQTHLSLRPFLMEETYEVLEALDGGDPVKLREELGDLLFQVMFHAVIAEETGDFRLSDVIRGIGEKLIRRHPHVFGEVEVEGVEGVLQNWDRIKAEEREENGEGGRSILDGVPVAMPALSQAAAIQRRAARVGFDWPDVEGVFEKIREEIEEVRIANTPEARSDEIGDLLFAVSHLANWYKIDPEDALRVANGRFRSRFRVVEELAGERKARLADLSLERLNEYWEKAKKMG